jgi:hypothetical protein
MVFEYITGVSKRQMMKDSLGLLNDIENRVRSSHSIETLEDCKTALKQIKSLERTLELMRWELPDTAEGEK